MRFSDLEISELTKAWFAISLAFAIVWRNVANDFWMVYLMAALTVGVAFLIHELAHKYVAQKFGCWAEFRSFNLGLILAIGMSVLLGTIFAAPGAVMISGLVTTEENGKIAAAGPITNLLLAALFFSLMQLFPFVAMIGVTGGVAAFAYMFLQIGYSVNSWLAFFNLIPFGPLDGVKVMRWSTQIWLALIVIAGVMTFIRF